MTSTKPTLSLKLMYILFFLIGLNFYGNAIPLIYIFAIFVMLNTKIFIKLPAVFFCVVLLFLYIVFSLIINDKALIYESIKLATYPILFVSNYSLCIFLKQKDMDSSYKIYVFYLLMFMFVFGNMLHFALDISISDLNNINIGKRILNDIWSNGTTPTTIVSGWGILTMPCLLYAYDNKKEHKVILLTNVFITSTFIVFSFIVATRLGVVNSFVILISFLILLIIQKDFTVNANTIIKLVISIFLIIVIVKKVQPLIVNSNLYARLNDNSLSFLDSNGRIEATQYLIAHFSESLFGGGYFTLKYGLQQHNMLFQMYDLYGLIPFLLVILLILNLIKKLILFFKSDEYSNSDKRFYAMVFLALMLYFFEEPAISSNFVVTGMLYAYMGYLYALI